MRRVIDRLRGDPAARPAVDPGLAGGLREWLEDGLAPFASELPEGAVVRVSKAAVSQVLLCERHQVALVAQPTAMNRELARGSLADALFRQWVTTGVVDDPVADGLSALGCTGDPGQVAAFVAAMAARERRELADELAAQVGTIEQHWPRLDGQWAPRTQERVVVPLAGGKIVVTGVVDLLLGTPAQTRSSVCIVEVKSGSRRVDHRHDLHLYGLLETLRSGAAPFQVATFYTSTGELDVEPFTEPLLVAALERLLDAASRLCRIAAGAPPAVTANPLCRWCPAFTGCTEGQQRAGAKDASEPEEERSGPVSTCAGAVER